MNIVTSSPSWISSGAFTTAISPQADAIVGLSAERTTASQASTIVTRPRMVKFRLNSLSIN
jgi:hypothetical protein